MLLLAPVAGRAQYATNFVLTDLDNTSLKASVQQNFSRLLTEFNMARPRSGRCGFDSVVISMPAQMCIMQIWKRTPFRTGDTEVIERCLHTYDGKLPGAQHPPLPQDGDKEQYQEAVIGFDQMGNIVDFPPRSGQ